MGNPIDDEHMEAAKKFRESVPEISESYREWQKSIVKETSFDAKTAELIMLSAAAAAQCKFCVHTHGQKAIKHGATNEEVAEVIHMASEIKAGAAMAYGLEALEYSEEQ